jgi:ABC-2 type transport system ATP-binding protein
MSLQLLSVTRRYGDEQALDAVSLDVREGDCYGLIGHNGAGKTTAMRIALGLERPDAGEVRLDGLDVRRAPREVHARLGGLIETPGFHEHLDAGANLRMLARLQGLSASEARAEAERQLARVGLAKAGAKPVRGFSQGMRQRLGIAQALLGSPSYLLLDEPTNGLDPEGSADVRALLARLVREEGVTVLVSSHQLHELAELCNRVAILQRGRALVEAETRALLGSVPGRFELATDDDERAARVLAEIGLRAEPASLGGLALELDGRGPGEIARHLMRAGLDLRRFGARPATLEELYLRYARGEAVPEPDTPRSFASSEEAARVVGDGPETATRRRIRCGLGRAMRYELARVLSRKSVVLLLALPAAVAALDVWREQARVAANLARVAAGELASATAVTGFGASADALSGGLPLLALVLAGLASQSLAGELARGTLRNVLLRPVTRLEVAGGKALAGVLLALAAYLALVAGAAGTSAATFGFRDLVEILPNGKPFPLVSAAELRPDFLRVLAVPLAALLGYQLVGFACGALVRGPAAALGLALGSILALDLARAPARGTELEGWLLSAHLPSPLGDSSSLAAFADRARGVSNSMYELGGTLAGVPRDVLVPSLWMLAAFAASAILLARRPVP